MAVAYGKIFRPYFLTVFGRGGVNLHPSLLPQLRGPAPMPAAILAGAARTGVTVQRLAAAMDAGDILAQTEVALDGTETTATLTARLARLGAALLWEVVDACATGTVAGRPQAEADATYCPLLTKEAGLIDWSRPARAIERAVRAYDPWPRAYTTWNGRRLVILEASVATEAAGAAGEVPGTGRRSGQAPGVFWYTRGGTACGCAACSLKAESRSTGWPSPTASAPSRMRASDRSSHHAACD